MIEHVDWCRGKSSKTLGTTSESSRHCNMMMSAACVSRAVHPNPGEHTLTGTSALSPLSTLISGSLGPSLPTYSLRFPKLGPTAPTRLACQHTAPSSVQQTPKTCRSTYSPICPKPSPIGPKRLVGCQHTAPICRKLGQDAPSSVRQAP